MKRNNQMRIASALAEISIQVTRRCKEDYLYELVAIIDSLDRGEDYVLFARYNGVDSMDRFVDGPASLFDGIKSAKQSLGVDCVFIFSLQDGQLMVKIHNESMGKGDLWLLTNGLSARGINYEVINQ